MRILIVDDSKVARIQCKKALPPELASSVVEASNGLEALDACRAGTFDLMLLDLTMPEMDGYQLLEAMSSLPTRPPVIVMSADIQTKARERVTALGAIAFVAKPANAAALLEALQRAGIGT